MLKPKTESEQECQNEHKVSKVRARPEGVFADDHMKAPRGAPSKAPSRALIMAHLIVELLMRFFLGVP